MSPSTEGRSTDNGFSLVEVIVALGLLVLLVVATLPQLLVGLRSNEVARFTVQEKGVAQTEVELMRNLPFHVAPAAGDYIDVLDRYFPRLEEPDNPIACATTGRFGAPPDSAAGYVAATQDRCPWEPPGAMYRTIRSVGSDFVLVLNTQFLDDSTPPAPVDPPAEYDSAAVGHDAPPTSQIGVTVSVFRTGQESRDPMTTYAQIGRRDQLDPLLESAVDVRVLELGSTTPDGLPVTATAGLMGLRASLTHASRASAVLSSTVTGISTGEQASGASISLEAPPSASQAVVDAGPGSLDATGCSLLCWGATRHSSVAVTSASGLPAVNSPVVPAQVSLQNPSHSGLTLGAGTGATLRPSLSLTGSLVQFDAGGAGSSGVRTGVAPACAGTGGGDPVLLVASGWLSTTLPEDPTNPSRTEACATSRAATVAVLPTTFAPQGVVRVRLPDAAARCVVAGASHVPTTTVVYRAEVERWSPGGYVPVASIDQSTTDDRLGAASLDIRLGEGYGEQADDYGRLSDYVDSWSSAKVSDVERVSGDNTASVSVPGVVTIQTAATRRGLDGESDPLSSVSLTLGRLSCSATDRR